MTADPREQAFYAELARQATGEAYRGEPSADDLALIEAVLARHAAGGAPAAPTHGDAIPGDAIPGDTIVVLPRRRSATRWVALALATAAAVVLAVATLTPDAGLRGSEGSWIAEGGQRRHGQGDALPMAVWLVAEDRACATFDADSVCAAPGTVLRLSAGEGERPRVEVRRGTVTVDGTLAVHTPAGELHGDAASRFDVTVSEDDGAVAVDVQRGALRLVAPEGTRPLDAGQRVRLGPDEASPTHTPAPAPAIAPPSPREPTSPRASARPSERANKPTPEPSALLVQARARLGEGDDAGAAKAYAALIEAHPSSAEAQAARVSLGKLRLAAGKPKAALALFDRYLQRGGPLAEEALWGKIQALDALGRDDALAAAVDRLVREQPRSVYRTRAQALVRR